MKPTIGDFFIPDNEVKAPASGSDSDIPAIIEMAKGVARCTSLCVYLIDYATRGFLWFSDNLSIFTGISGDELRRMGYDIFIEHVSEAEQLMLLEINRAGWEKFQQTPVEERLNGWISYSFHFVVGKRKVLVDHRLTPVKLDEQGACRVALCVFSPSSLREPGNVVWRRSDSPEFWEYSLAGRRWHRRTLQPLSDTERQVLLMSFQGQSQQEIADAIHYSVETVKHVKRQLFERFCVKNIAQAVNYASNYRLI